MGASSMPTQNAAPGEVQLIIPSREIGHALTEGDVTAAIQNGVIDFRMIDGLIPKGTTDTWTPEPRIQWGFKFEFSSGGSDWHFHGHAPDPAQKGQKSNASNGWIIRISCGKKWLLQDVYVNEEDARQAPTQWVAGRGLSGKSEAANTKMNMSHIPMSNEILASGKSRYAPDDEASGSKVVLQLVRRKSLSDLSTAVPVNLIKSQ